MDMDKAISGDGHVEQLTDKFCSVNISEDQRKSIMTDVQSCIAGLSALNTGGYTEIGDSVAHNQSGRRGTDEVKPYSVCVRTEACIRSCGENTTFTEGQAETQIINGKSNQNCRKHKRSVSANR